MRKLYLLVCLNVFCAIASNAQKLPTEYRFSTDGRQLLRGAILNTGWYQRDSIRSVYLNFSQSDYWTQLTNNYASETEIPATMIVNGTTYDSVGVRFRGNTSYTTIGSSQKKSFAVTVDFVKEDQKIMGFKNLKFNNAHQDSSFMREVLFCRLAKKYTPIAKANYIRLFLNNVDWGIYPNIQSVDNTFLEDWFLSNDGPRFRATVENTGTPQGGWGDGTAGMNFLGADTSLYLNRYELKSSDIDSPWHRLVAACSTLSITNTSNMALVKSKIDVDKALWFLAAENIFTDDDSYVMKGKMDYYVYYEPETGRTTPIEYDGNSSFQRTAATSTSWTPFKNVTNANYPLLNKLINVVPEWRQRYLAHYRTILNETFTNTNIDPIIDSMNTQINALVTADTKKLYSTAAFNRDVPRLKTFITNRRTFLLSNTEVAQIAPTISSAPFYNSLQQQYVNPVQNEVVNIKATVSHTSGLNKVLLYYATGVVGNFATTQMYDDGNHNDGAASDGVFGAQIPGYLANTLVRYYVEAIANNASFSASYLPQGAEHDVFVYRVGDPPSVANGVVVNEIVASNTNGARDEANDLEDWIELYNKNNYSVNLSRCYLTDDTTTLNKWRMPVGTNISPNGYLIFWADNELAEGILHTNFKLSASGEAVVLSDSNLNIIDKVVFGTQSNNIAYARIPNGTGNFVFQTPTYNANNETVTPVKLISFNVNKSREGILLNWIVTNEFNLKQYEIERSINGLEFERIGIQKAISSGNENKYDYLDKTTIQQTIYYRLKFVDENGTFAYSAVIKVLPIKELSFVLSNVYPNPAKTMVNVAIESNDISASTISIINVEGKIVKQKQLTLNPGNTNLLIDVSQLKAGNYFIKLVNALQQVQVVHFVKQ